MSTAAVGSAYVCTGTDTGNWKVVAGQQYADMYIAAGTVASTLGAVDAYSKVNPAAMWVSNLSSVVTNDTANGQITLATAGVYSVNFWATFDTAAVAVGGLYLFKFALDGVTSPRVLSVQKNTAGVDRLTCSASGLISVTAGKILSIHAAAGNATTATTNITVRDAGLGVVLMKQA